MSGKLVRIGIRQYLNSIQTLLEISGQEGLCYTFSNVELNDNNLHLAYFVYRQYHQLLCDPNHLVSIAIQTYLRNELRNNYAKVCGPQKFSNEDEEIEPEPETEWYYFSEVQDIVHMLKGGIRYYFNKAGNIEFIIQDDKPYVYNEIGILEQAGESLIVDGKTYFFKNGDIEYMKVYQGFDLPYHPK